MDKTKITKPLGLDRKSGAYSIKGSDLQHGRESWERGSNVAAKNLKSLPAPPPQSTFSSLEDVTDRIDPLRLKLPGGGLSEVSFSEDSLWDEDSTGEEVPEADNAVTLVTPIHKTERSNGSFDRSNHLVQRVPTPAAINSLKDYQFKSYLAESEDWTFVPANRVGVADVQAWEHRTDFARKIVAYGGRFLNKIDMFEHLVQTSSMSHLDMFQHLKAY